MTGIKLIFFKLYVFLLAIWMGAGIYSMLSTHQAWYDDPVGFVDHITTYPVPGAVEPLSTLIIILTVVTFLCLLLFLRFHGQGRRTAFVSFIGTFLILMATYLYFIPAHAKLFDEAGSFNDQVVSMSRSWIIFDYVRLFFLIVIFFTSLVALAKFRSNRH